MKSGYLYPRQINDLVSCVRFIPLSLSGRGWLRNSPGRRHGLCQGGPGAGVLLERQDNVMFYLRIPARESRVLDQVVTLDFSTLCRLGLIGGCREALLRRRVEARQDEGKNRYCPGRLRVEFQCREDPLAADPFLLGRSAPEVDPSRQAGGAPGRLRAVPGCQLLLGEPADEAGRLARREAAVPGWPRSRSTGRQPPCQSECRPTVSSTAWAIGVRHAGDDGAGGVPHSRAGDDRPRVRCSESTTCATTAVSTCRSTSTTLR